MKHALILTLVLTAPAVAHSRYRLAGYDWEAEFAPEAAVMRFQGGTFRMRLEYANQRPSLFTTAGRVRYGHAYPGIHLDYYRSGTDLEYDFIVEPGADPRRIAFTFDGVQGLGIDEYGDLILQLPFRQLRQKAPVAYQVYNGRRHFVPVRFARQHRTVGFALGSYDPRRPLIIDPVITMSRLFGSSGSDSIEDFTTDSAGNLYAVRGNTVPKIVTKFTANGTLLFERSLPSEITGETSMTLDSAGNFYIAGKGSGCPANTTTTIGEIPGGSLIVTKLLPDGQTRVYTTCLRAGGVNTPGAITVDSAGAAYVAGATTSSFFPATSEFGAIIAGVTHAFMFKVSPAGDALPYSIVTGNDTTAKAIAVDAAGNAYVAGFTSSNFTPVNARQPVFGGGSQDAFYMKIRPDGLLILTASFLGGTGSDVATSMVLTEGGSFVVGGTTTSTNFPQAGASSLPFAAGFNGFLTKVANNTTDLVYSTSIASNFFNVFSLAARSNGDVYAAVNNATSAVDARVVKLDPAGAQLFAGTIGGNGFDFSQRVAVTPTGFAMAGMTASTDFPRTTGPGLNGASDTFVAVFEERANLDLIGVPFRQSVGLTNFGPDPATSVRITLSAAGLNLVTSTDPRCVHKGLGEICTIGTMQANASTTLSYTSSAAVTVTATSAVFDPNTANNSIVH